MSAADTSALTQAQLAMARYLRNPTTEPAPAGIEERRLKIYRDLVYNNIEGFISGGFPVLHSLYQADDWHELVRLFVADHHCHTPYFLEISQEFLRFLMEDHKPRACDPVFMTELAHYEWVELALDVSEEQPPSELQHEQFLAATPILSPLAWVLSYQFPVHRIGPGFQPEQADQPSFLLVYRDAADAVQFMELNAATARLLELLRDNVDQSGAALLGQLASELAAPEQTVTQFGLELLAPLLTQRVVGVQ